MQPKVSPKAPPAPMDAPAVSFALQPIQVSGGSTPTPATPTPACPATPTRPLAQTPVESPTPSTPTRLPLPGTAPTTPTAQLQTLAISSPPDGKRSFLDVIQGDLDQEEELRAFLKSLSMKDNVRILPVRLLVSPDGSWQVIDLVINAAAIKSLSQLLELSDDRLKAVPLRPHDRKRLLQGIVLMQRDRADSQPPARKARAGDLE